MAGVRLSAHWTEKRGGADSAHGAACGDSQEQLNRPARDTTKGQQVSKRTEGDWTHLEPDQVRGPQGEFVADCNCNRVRVETDFANARFISRGPAMLKLLKEALRHFQGEASQAHTGQHAEHCVACKLARMITGVEPGADITAGY